MDELMKFLLDKFGLIGGIIAFGIILYIAIKKGKCAIRTIWNKITGQ